MLHYGIDGMMCLTKKWSVTIMLHYGIDGFIFVKYVCWQIGKGVHYNRKKIFIW